MRDCSLIFLRVYSLLFADTGILCWLHYRQVRSAMSHWLTGLPAFQDNECTFYCVTVLSSYD